VTGEDLKESGILIFCTFSSWHQSSNSGGGGIAGTKGAEAINSYSSSSSFSDRVSSWT
jgi:hypothetical protein